uniref:Reverse transcriptase Ty1/copia-type domain-containing protein n=1 Tax=Tanacetum cinerariifolium TaxID=118510 RepID=A0A699H5U3_TANCI|nr:hypothetical protein [Tanacetum cinerariifolium]
MNYEPVLVENQANKSVGDKIEKNTGFKTCEKPVSQVEQVFLEELKKLKRQEKEANDAAKSLRKEATYDIQNASTSSTNLINTASTPLSTTGPSRAFNDGELLYPNPSKYSLLEDPLMPHHEDIYASPSERIFTDSSYDDECVVKQKEDGIFISQDKYVAEILKKIDFLSVKTASTPIETHKPLVKDEEAADVDVTPKTSHLHAVKRIFRYLKGQPKLGLWHPKVSAFDLEAYSDYDYAGVNLDRKSTTREAEYVAAAHCYGQVL